MTAATPGPPPRDRHDGQVTPGQAAFAEYYGRQAGAALIMPDSWAMQSDAGRADWEAAAQAAIDAATEGTLRACGYTLADIARFLEAEAAPQQPQPAQVDPVPTASWQHAIRALAGIRDSYDTGTMAHDTAHTALDRLAGLYPHGEQPAPELAADDGQALFTRCWQGVHASTAGVRPAQLWRSMDAHDRSLWAYAVFEMGLLEKVIAAHRADIAKLEGK